MQFVKPLPFTDAVEKLGSRSPIGSAMMSSEWGDVPVALRERAFFSSQVESIRFLQRARDSIADYLQGARDGGEQGPLATGSRAAFVEQMRAFALKEGMGPLLPEHANTLRDITSEKRLGLIFDTQTRQAGDYGYWRQGMDPDVLNEFPAQRFIRVQEVKQERDSHRKFEDQVYLKTDPIWAQVINEDFGVPWGPWAWGCGHDVEDVDRGEAEQLGLVKAGQELQPEVKSFNENLEASTKGLDPDLLDKLKAEFGDQAAFEGDTVKWADVAVPDDGHAPRKSPVSDAIDVTMKGYTKELVDGALAAIDRVHDDGVLPNVELKETTTSSFGFVKPKLNTDGGIETDFIAVRKDGPWRSLTTVHEMGHFLDLEAIGTKGDLATRLGDADMKVVIDAAKQTDAVKELMRKLAATINPDTRNTLEYLLSPEEIWARSYAQFVAERGESVALRDDLARSLAKKDSKQWATADFAPVAAEIEKLFTKLGWI